VETGTAWGVPAAVEPSDLFCQLIPRVIMLVFRLVSAAIEDENCFRFKWLWHYAVIGQGHHPALLRSFGWRAPFFDSIL
jgi:hypothetical protein